MNDEAITEKILSEAHVLDGHVVNVSHLDVMLPDGKHARREVVRHVGASAIVPVDEEGNVTLVRQFRTPIGQVLLEIPAGKLDSKSEDRLEAARRELREETGLTAKRWTQLTDIVTTPGFCDEKISIYLATGLERGEAAPDEDEFLGIVRLPLSALVDMAVRGELTDSKTAIGVLLAEKRLTKEG